MDGWILRIISNLEAELLVWCLRQCALSQDCSRQHAEETNN